MGENLFIKLNQENKDKNIFVFPHAGANPATYVAEFRKLKGDFCVHVLSLPGRTFQNKDNALINFNQTFELIWNYVQQFAGNKNILFGHSMGALFVYELVKKIELEAKINIHSFGLSALKIPDLRFRKSKISELNDADFKKYLVKNDMLPEALIKEPLLLNDSIQTIRNDFKIIDSYGGNINLFKNKTKGYILGGEKDLLATPDDLYQWHELLDNIESPVIFNGDHFYLFNNLGLIMSKLLA
jgi:surfactin synthase thioesterase subunit